MGGRIVGCAIIAATGCRFVSGAAPSDALSIIGDTSDAEVMGSEGTGVNCYGSAQIDMVCLGPTLPSPAITYAIATTIDTDNEPSCIRTTANGVPVCVIAAASIMIADMVTVNVHGGQPLVLVATTGMIMLMGGGSVLDVGSHLSATPGPANLSGPACATGATAPVNHGGGYGGSFGGVGGTGGVDSDSNAGGVAGPAFGAPTTLHGGCLGGIGGGQQSTSAGGGAVALIAPMIHIDGTVTASGAGGAGATINSTGGNGGGAGGLIVLDAPMITGGGMVLAQGGGGGEGAGGNNGHDGFDGFDALNKPSQTLGGSGGSSAGDGGDGASNTQLDGAVGGIPQAGGGAQGGGGGGGAAGVNKVFQGSPPAGLNIAPPKT